MCELETIMEDSVHHEGATITATPRAMHTAEVQDSPRKQERVYLLVENQKKSVPRLQQKVPPKFKKYVENITEARIHLKAFVMKKGGLRMKTKRTSTNTIMWPPKYTTNAAEETVSADYEGRTRRLNYLYYA